MVANSHQIDMVKCSRYSLWRENNVIFIYSVGLWGKSHAERFYRDYIALRARVSANPWAVISHSQNWILGSPDIEPILATLAKPEDNIGLVVSIRIINDNALTQFQLKKITKNVPQSYTTLSFTDEKEAFVSLQEYGFTPKTQLFSDALSMQTQ